MCKFYEYYKKNDRFIIPKLLKNSQNIIIMEYLEGETITELNNYEISKYISLSLHCGGLNPHLKRSHLHNFRV